MRTGAAAAALLLCCAGGAFAQRRENQIREAGKGILDPMITEAPDLRQPLGPFSGTRDFVPAGEADNTFIGGWADPAAAPPAPPRPVARRPAAPPPGPQRLPGEGVLPPRDDGLPAAGDTALQPLDTPGEPQTLAALPAAPLHEDMKVAAAAAPAETARPAAPAARVFKPIAGEKQSLPDMDAIPQHEAAAAQPKDVELDDAALVHDAIPDLIDILKHGSPRLRERAADELGRRGSDAKTAVPALEEALKGPDRLKASAALALGDIGGDRRELQKLLKPLLKSKNADVRTSAETALDRLAGGR